MTAAQGSEGHLPSDDRPRPSLDSPSGTAAIGFYVYVIAFDQEQFGIYATKEAAEEALAGQIAEGGPAWDGCQIDRWLVAGAPEIAS